jgi:ATP synthase D chain, mitochondrial (ATP5H)
MSLRQKLGKTLLTTQAAARAPASGAVVNYTQQHSDLTNKWLQRLRLTANTHEGRDKLGQIQSILEFFQKPSQNTGSLPAINWSEWESNVHTAGVVGKIKAKYDAFMKAEYNVESAVGQVGHQSERIKALEVANTYNFMLYLSHYAGHLEQLETMRNIGDIQEMSMLEMMHLMPGSDTLSSISQEMGDISPEDYVEDGIFTRLCTQFSWGSRYNPPFNHSSDTLNAVVATMAKLGK